MKTLKEMFYPKTQCQCFGRLREICNVNEWKTSTLAVFWLFYCLPQLQDPVQLPLGNVEKRPHFLKGAANNCFGRFSAIFVFSNSLGGSSSCKTLCSSLQEMKQQTTLDSTQYFFGNGHINEIPCFLFLDEPHQHAISIPLQIGPVDQWELQDPAET